MQNLPRLAAYKYNVKHCILAQYIYCQSTLVELSTHGALRLQYVIHIMVPPQTSNQSSSDPLPIIFHSSFNHLLTFFQPSSNPNLTLFQPSSD